MTLIPPRRTAWFRVKRYGYGAGLPIAWEGWALVAGFIGFAILAPLVMPRWAFLTAMLVLTAAFVVVVRQRSDRDWRWRNGSDD